MSLHPNGESIHPGAYLSSCLPDIWVLTLALIKCAAAKVVPHVLYIYAHCNAFEFTSCLIPSNHFFF